MQIKLTWAWSSALLWRQHWTLTNKDLPILTFLIKRSLRLYEWSQALSVLRLVGPTVRSETKRCGNTFRKHFSAGETSRVWSEGFVKQVQVWSGTSFKLSHRSAAATANWALVATSLREWHFQISNQVTLKSRDTTVTRSASRYTSMWWFFSPNTSCSTTGVSCNYL